MKIRHILVAVVVAAIFGPAPAWADYAAGKTAYDKGEFEAAYREWLPLAKGGSANAQFAVATLYRDGFFVNQNYEIAISWFREAALQSEVRAIGALGYMFNNGKGLPEDKGKAECLFLVAAESGDAVAQWNLYHLRRKNPGIDFSAGPWLDRAAAQGHASSLIVKGRIVFLNPFYIDKTEGYFYFVLAARQGDKDAEAEMQSELAKRSVSGMEQLEAARKKAAEWRPILEKRRAIPPEIFERCLPD